MNQLPDELDGTPKSIGRPTKRRAKDTSLAFWTLVRPRVGLKRILRDLWSRIIENRSLDGAAVMAFYSMLSIFPAAILFLTLLPYLPIANLDQMIVEALHRVMPVNAAEMLTSTVTRVVSQRHEGLLSFGLLATVWAASSGLQAMMQQLHSTFDAKETRPYWKRRLIAVGLVFGVGILVIGAFALVIAGDLIYQRVLGHYGEQGFFLWVFHISRWLTIFTLFPAALSMLYHFGPNVRQRYRLITPGSLLAAVLFVVASLLFRAYVAHFGSYEATYGSLGAAIVLLLWLYVGGFVILIGSEVNALLEGYARKPRAA